MTARDALMAARQHTATAIAATGCAAAFIDAPFLAVMLALIAAIQAWLGRYYVGRYEEEMGR